MGKLKKTNITAMGRIEKNIFSLGESITEEQLAFFDKNGYIIFRKFLLSESVQLFISEMQRVQSEWIEQGIEKVNGIPVKYGKDESGNAIVQRFCFLSQYSKVMHELLQSPQIQMLTRFLYPYEGRVAEDEKDGLVLNNYLRTPQSTFTHMGWHTDSPRDLFMGQRIMPMLNVGIHLDDCPFSNGGLRILPGTHKQGIFKLMFGKKYYIDKDADPNEVGFNIEAGDLTVHDGRIWHRVEQSPHLGEKSRRRVMYIPVVTGKYKPKSEYSKTPFYHKFSKNAHH
ncbi:MAG: phytanoyl-CoA dioxygenase family protein [Ferruginibacter sp.]